MDTVIRPLLLRTRRRFHKARQHVDRGRLAGAVGAEESEALALGDVQRYVVYGDEAAKRLARRP